MPSRTPRALLFDLNTTPEQVAEEWNRISSGDVQTALRVAGL